MTIFGKLVTDFTWKPGVGMILMFSAKDQSLKCTINRLRIFNEKSAGLLGRGSRGQTKLLFC